MGGWMEVDGWMERDGWTAEYSLDLELLQANRMHEKIIMLQGVTLSTLQVTQ